MCDDSIIAQSMTCRRIDFVEKSPGVYVSVDPRFTSEYTYDELLDLASKHQIEIRIATIYR